MKRFLFLFILAFSSMIARAQPETTPKEKATVYFVRSNMWGALYNFTFFDGDKLIGKLPGKAYLTYECEPGKHLFWARSENRSFVEAELEAGKTYLIDAISKLGVFISRVRLVPVYKDVYDLKSIQKIVSNKDPKVIKPTKLAFIQQNTKAIPDAIRAYDYRNRHRKNVVRLTPHMTITPEDLVYTKKSKKSNGK